MDYPFPSPQPKKSDTEKTILIIAVFLIVLLVLVGGGVAFYFLVYKKHPDIIKSCECDSTPGGYSTRVDAVKADSGLQKKYSACKGDKHCEQEACLNAGYCYSPVFVKSGTSPPWCYKKSF